MHNKCFKKTKYFKKIFCILLSFLLNPTLSLQNPKTSAYDEATPEQINEINRIKENTKNEIRQNIEKQKQKILNDLEKQKNEAYNAYERAILENLKNISKTTKKKYQKNLKNKKNKS